MVNEFLLLGRRHTIDCDCPAVVGTLVNDGGERVIPLLLLLLVAIDERFNIDDACGVKVLFLSGSLVHVIEVNVDLSESLIGMSDDGLSDGLFHEVHF